LQKELLEAHNPENVPCNLAREFPGTPNPLKKDLFPEDSVGKSFLMPPEDDGTQHRACIIKIIEHDQQHAHDWRKVLTKLKCLMNNHWEKVDTYNQISNFIEQGET
jgi:hypothetical protein